jgi:hypothetical protein
MAPKGSETGIHAPIKNSIPKWSSVTTSTEENIPGLLLSRKTVQLLHNSICPHLVCETRRLSIRGESYSTRRSAKTESYDLPLGLTRLDVGRKERAVRELTPREGRIVRRVTYLFNCKRMNEAINFKRRTPNLTFARSMDGKPPGPKNSVTKAIGKASTTESLPQ